MQVYSGVLNISASFKCILLDAYGVFWDEIRCTLFPGSKEIMELLVKSEKIVGILSNSSFLAVRELDKLQEHGLIEGVHFHFLLTSGQVANHIFQNEKLPFKTPQKKYWLFGGLGSNRILHKEVLTKTQYIETEDVQEADFVYLSTPHINGKNQTDVEVFRKELKKIGEKKNPMVCTNPDRFALQGTPPKTLVRQGGIAALYEELGGFVYYVGKPANIAYLSAMECFSKLGAFSVKDVLMVGDTPETDVRGARSFGMVSALIMQTGIMANRIAQQGLKTAVEKLPSQDLPDFFIERL